MRKPGECIFHAGIPIELLHLLGSTVTGELWRVKPLFVDDQTPRDVFIRKGDHCSHLHTQKAA
jgi:hypothetical protein